MGWLKGIPVALLLVLTICSVKAQTSKKIVCGYDSSSYLREEPGKYLPEDMAHALSHCTHILYQYAVLDGAEYRVVPKYPNFEVKEAEGNYKAVTALKKRYPGLTILLSVGGWADTEGDSEEYLSLLRDPINRGKFISSVTTILKDYGFDGIDLAWQFPLIRVKQRSKWGSIWHKIKKEVGLAKGSKDLQAEEHRAGFTALIKELATTLRPTTKVVTASVIPHTNYTLYWDLGEISPYLDAIHVQAYDYLTAEPKISPEEADYPASLYYIYDRNPNFNVDTQIRWFIDNGAPADKLILGIPAYGRTWRLTADSAPSGVPPIQADGEGAEGHLTHKRGISSQPEICLLTKGANHSETSIRVATDPSNRLGTYAWRSDSATREGFWVGYEDVNTARYKADFAKKRLLGGVGLFDLSMDDYRGLCGGERYPLLKAVKAGLM